MSTYQLESGAVVIDRDDLRPVAIPESRILFTGDDFIADILYQPVSDGLNGLRINTIANPGVEIIEGPEGLVYDKELRRFTFDTSQLFEGEPAEVREKEVRFLANVFIESIVENRVESRPVERSFTVRRPVVNVLSNTPQRLISNAQNDLSFLVEGLSESEIQLRESSVGLTISGSRISWSPAGNETTISVFRIAESGEPRLIDTRRFEVVPPPPPRVFIRRHQTEELLGPQNLVNINDDQIEIVIQPDPSFLQDYPNDARYEMGDLRLSFYQQGRPPQTITLRAADLPQDAARNRATRQVIYGPFRLSQLAGDLRGSEVRFEIQALNRINYRGLTEPVPTNQFQDFFSLNTR
ncbi:MAG: hypothetical protein LAT75_12235 [Candidatus Cyclonatronum sp.]|uniref:hypothetical protein n=1 Tax=Cyclonatronum sp. TaxID=3024185 RepID=UPI0025C69C5F|nr:hypothetical protein [Cyclonatronum sp.]MCC5934937.1 hypothetical protein [Balneolales bacterium]MCH8487628.1 hypothetical protein [Cyclonatronum sp.]